MMQNLVAEEENNLVQNLFLNEQFLYLFTCKQQIDISDTFFITSFLERGRDFYC